MCKFFRAYFSFQLRSRVTMFLADRRNFMKLFEAIEKVCAIDEEAMKKTKKQWLSIAKPLFSLGKLEDIITKISGIKGASQYSIEKKALIVMCADNGVVEEGVTQTGQEVTAVVTENFSRGLTSACIMSKIAGVDVFPVDIGVSVDVKGVTDKKIKVAYGTRNIVKGAAMTREQAVSAIEAGINKVIELRDKGYDIIATGEMGIGNTTTSSAIMSFLFDLPAEAVTGRGAGLTKEGLRKKVEAVKSAIDINRPDRNDSIDVISKIGGLDIAGLTGVFIGGGACHVPIVIDGFISAISAVLAVRICPRIKDYIIASHVSKEPAGKLVLNKLGLSPIITADMCLGEGTGAVALFPLLDMAYGVYSQMHTFQNWNGDETYHILE